MFGCDCWSNSPSPPQSPAFRSCPEMFCALRPAFAWSSREWPAWCFWKKTKILELKIGLMFLKNQNFGIENWGFSSIFMPRCDFSRQTFRLKSMFTTDSPIFISIFDNFLIPPPTCSFPAEWFWHATFPPPPRQTVGPSSSFSAHSLSPNSAGKRNWSISEIHKIYNFWHLGTL